MGRAQDTRRCSSCNTLIKAYERHCEACVVREREKAVMKAGPEQAGVWLSYRDGGLVNSVCVSESSYSLGCPHCNHMGVKRSIRTNKPYWLHECNGCTAKYAVPSGGKTPTNEHPYAIKQPQIQKPHYVRFENARIDHSDEASKLRTQYDAPLEVILTYSSPYGGCKTSTRMQVAERVCPHCGCDRVIRSTATDQPYWVQECSGCRAYYAVRSGRDEPTNRQIAQAVKREDPKPRFESGQHVSVVSGFYAGNSGTIVQCIGDDMYRIRFEFYKRRMPILGGECLRAIEGAERKDYEP